MSSNMKNATLPHAKQPSYVTPQDRVTFVNKLADLVATSAEQMWFFMQIWENTLSKRLSFP
jgi:hypothetical protein